MVIFERTLWRQSGPPAYHHQLIPQLNQAVAWNLFDLVHGNFLKFSHCFEIHADDL